MSCCSEKHKKLNEDGIGACSVPMWCGGLPAGFCDEPAYGRPTPCQTFRNGFTGEIQRMDGKYSGYVPFLACPGHGGPESRVFPDGNMMCAVYPDFVNLQESAAGFGETTEDARKELKANALKES